MVEQVAVRQSRSVLGATGLLNRGGRIQEEYLSALKDWQKLVRIYLEMRDDATIGTLLEAIKLPLLAAEFDVEPAGESDADAKAADFLWENLQQMPSMTWRQHVRDALDYIDFGWAIAEVSLEKREDGRLWLYGLDPRGQETLERWEFDEHDRATAFIQRDPDTGRQIVLPLEKCVHVVYRGRKGNPQGNALLRSLYRPWRFLKDLENLEGIGIERDVGGMPIAHLDEPVESYTDNDIVNLKKALQGLRMDEESYLIEPPGVTIRPYQTTNKAYDVAAVIDRYHKMLLMRFFAQFLTLGMGQVGTQALVRGSHDFFMLALEAIQQELLETWNAKLVSFLFRFNSFPGATGLPRLNWDRPGKVDLAGLVDSYTKAKGASLLTPVREDEEHVRGLMDLPDLPEGVGEEPRDLIESPAFPPTGF